MADVRFVRQQVFGEFSSLKIQSYSEIIVHAGPPEIRLVIELRVIGTCPRRGYVPFGNFLRLRIKHCQSVAVEFATPHAVLRVDVASAASRAFRGEVITNGLLPITLVEPKLCVV